MLSAEDVKNKLDEFEIGFKHPFGPHANPITFPKPETTEEILERKRGEIKDNGFTLWSFQNRNIETTLKPWMNELEKYKGKTVMVLCKTCNAENPKSVPQYCAEYSEDFGEDSETKWKKIPKTMKVPHPKRHKFACGFKVKKILEVEDKQEIHKVGLRWLRLLDSATEKAGWSDARYGRGEVLIIRDDDEKTKNLPLSAILELEFPYVVRLKF